MLIGLETHLVFVKTVFVQFFLKMQNGRRNLPELIFHTCVSDRSILQRSMSHVTFFKFLIRPQDLCMAFIAIQTI